MYYTIESSYRVTTQRSLERVIISHLFEIHSYSVEFMFQYCIESSLEFLWSFIRFPRRIYSLYQYSMTSVTMYYKLDGLNKRNLLSHSSGANLYKMKVSSRLVLSEECEGESVACLSSTAQYFASSICHSLAHRNSTPCLPSSSYCSLPVCMPVSNMPFL